MRMNDLIETCDPIWECWNGFARRHCLLEDRIEWMRQNLLPRLDNVYGDDISGEDLFKKVLDIDPTGKKIYSQWIIKQLLSGTTPDDLDQLAQQLATFDQIKKEKDFPSNHRDINSINSLDELSDVISQYHSKVNNSQSQLINKVESETRVIEEVGKWKVVKPLTQLAAGWWGRDSEWCTAYGFPQSRHPDRSSHFNSYQEGDLLIFLKNGEAKYQAYIDENGSLAEFYDTEETDMSLNDFGIFLKNFPKTYERIHSNLLDHILGALDGEHDLEEDITAAEIKIAVDGDPKVIKTIASSMEDFMHSESLTEKNNWLYFAVEFQSVYYTDTVSSWLGGRVLDKGDPSLIARHQKLNQPKFWLNMGDVLMKSLVKFPYAMRQFIDALSAHDREVFVGSIRDDKYQQKALDYINSLSTET